MKMYLETYLYFTAIWRLFVVHSWIEGFSAVSYGRNWFTRVKRSRYKAYRTTKPNPPDYLIGATFDVIILFTRRSFQTRRNVLYKLRVLYINLTCLTNHVRDSPHRATAIFMTRIARAPRELSSYAYSINLIRNMIWFGDISWKMKCNLENQM